MPGLTDSTFLHEPFLQRLPANIWMVLASTCKNKSIEELAQLAYRIVVVPAPPSVTNVCTQSFELDQFKAEITSLTQVVNSLRCNYHSNSRSQYHYSSNHHRSPSPAWRPQPPPNSPMSAGTTATLEIRHANAHLPTPSQETIKSATNGG